MRLPTRRTLWLSAAFLLVVVGGVWFLASRSRITQANFDRIHDGMTLEEVEEILGMPDPTRGRSISHETFTSFWHSGPNCTCIAFDTGGVFAKIIRLATVWETLMWYAKIGAEMPS